MEPEPISAALVNVAETQRARFAAGEFGCPALVAPENYCFHGKHGHATDKGPGHFLEVSESRACPAVAAKEAIRLRREIIGENELVQAVAAKYHVVFDVTRPLWSQLLAAMDPERPITWRTDRGAQKPLRALLEMVERGCRLPNKDAPHLLLRGNCGTGKTTLQTVLYLALAEAGLSAALVDSIQLRKLAMDLNSKFGPTAEAADRRLSALSAKEVLCWSDVGDTPEGRGEFATMLTALLERFSGRLVMSSNLDPHAMAQHPDIGKRAVSRMFAGRHGKASVEVELDGPDQRTAGTPLRAVFEI